MLCSGFDRIRILLRSHDRAVRIRFRDIIVIKLELEVRGRGPAILFAEQRHQTILQKLNREQSVKTAELIKLFGVSVETIRRDLDYLERMGCLKRVHGGAIPAEIDYTRELPFTVRETQFADRKRELAETAVRYVEEGQSIALEIGTTNTAFARALKKRVERLTVLTNSLPIANELVSMPNYTIIFAGGVIRNQEQCVVGELAETFVEQFHVDTFFMNMSGLTPEQGVTDYGIGEVQLKKKLMKIAKQTIVLADSSKFGAVSLLKVCDYAEVDLFITDSKIDPGIVEAYRQHGIEIVSR